MARELRLLQLESAPGCSAWPVSDASITELEAAIVGPNDTPYQHGVSNSPQNAVSEPQGTRDALLLLQASSPLSANIFFINYTISSKKCIFCEEILRKSKKFSQISPL